MRYETAARELAKVYYKGWSLRPQRPYTSWNGNLFEVVFEFVAPDSRDYPYYERKSIAGNRFTIDLSAIDERDTDVFHRVVFDNLYDWERHEAQEFYVVDGWAPFHPHRPDGRDRWDATNHARHMAERYAVSA